MSELYQPGQHPDADQLSAFLEHVLPAHEQEQTLAHLAICPHCRSVVGLSLPAVEGLPKPQLVQRRWFSGWNLAGPAVAALAALVLVGVHIRNKSIVRSQAPSAQVAVTHPPATPEQLPSEPLRKQSLPSTPPRARRHSAAARANAVTEPRAAERAAINGRSVSPLIAPAPAIGGVMGGILGGVGRGVSPLIAPAPVIGGVMGGILGGVSDFHGTLVDSNPAWDILSHHPLPSGLSALSTVTNGRQVVAIDVNNTPFFSDDAGVHWNVVPPRWTGRAVKVELVSLDHEAPTQSTASAPVRLDQSAAANAAPSDSLAKIKSRLTGAVTDPTGASIPGAAVVVTNTVTHVARRTQTDPDGHYVVDNLEPGTYFLAADANGFKQRQLPSMSLTSGQQGQADFILALSSASQSVMIEGTDKAALAAPRVKQMVAGTPGAAPMLPRFEITTDTGERWTSTDGRVWKRK